MVGQMVQTLSGEKILHLVKCCHLLLFQNLLFYYDNEQSSKPAGVIFLEVIFHKPFNIKLHGMIVRVCAAEMSIELRFKC